ncbi:S-layer homology domain-containing protein [Bifidobacterium miconisargentati]|uniref:S-layer homology domain-containing protein n=1 Tax=Bifidobacterium miconisargentati TaxID=2834437 RepID=UPI001BDBDA2D|nr:S-layer homology domain-containing protein [Bifidobacterium miconisargentati]MBW3091348.1 S-layer homology domain-containing protein [Bifidobacterium miconisargentati]
MKSFEKKGKAMKRIGKALAFIAGVAMALTGGISTAQADGIEDEFLLDPYTVSNVKVSEIGAHTANVTFDWKINGITADQIENVCFISTVTRVTSVTKVRDFGNWIWGAGKWAQDPSCSGGVMDDELTQETYDQIYGLRSNDNYLTADGQTYAKATLQDFYRYNAKSWDGTSTSGTFSLPVIGLTPNTLYGNAGHDYQTNAASLVSAAAHDLPVGQTTSVDLRQFNVGLRIKLKDGVSVKQWTDYISFDADPVDVPDFRTTAEPAATTEDKLTPETKDNVTVDNSGKVEAGKSARVYINQLKEACQPDDTSCFWYGYIYSTPKKLTGPDGSPILPVEKDDAGKFYVDVYVPDGLSGDHKIALVDESGVVQGWTDVTVDRGSTSPFSDVVKDVTPHYADILWLADRQITTGFSDGTYRGMNAVNRQDMAAFLYRLAGSPAFTPDWSKNPFTDVNEKSAHAKEVLWLASTGITKGYPDGTFGGMRPVVRQDMAAFLHRLAVYEKADDPSGEAKEFTDVTDQTPHAEDIAWLARTGVTTGYGDGSFRGMTAVYRQDMAAFLHRMKDNVLK